MGGYGSGSWQSCDARKTVEGCLTLNIFKLHQDRIIIAGGLAHGVLRFANGSEISYALEDNRLALSYHISSGPHAGQEMRYSIAIVATHPYFGGVRLWFRCPTCNRRAGKLHLARLKFECRKCGDLAYQSTRELTLRKIFAMIQAQDRRTARIYQKYGLEKP